MSGYELAGIIITIGIFIIALVSAAIAVFSVLGNATQRRLTRLEDGQAKLEDGQAKLEEGLVNLKNEFNKRLTNLETELKEIKGLVRSVLRQNGKT